ncbi:cytochrome p450 [Hirsutella rhossiliensis]|uniref:Cytochrome p450 domain-containing protein n=1 Tax=Hirsutella rhossiliensis TaxID=111463 RepID=A0A9P8NAU7_9HYPO|nr:cytochrome p450 domain-containing protein [Hirsutella rhossiliensis]KAH0967767.1 cytochrome p450 domain-containing protein [Hirsutella rhossiliensis]
MDLPPQGILEFQHWLKYKDMYGPISSITVLGQTRIILHDKEAAHDLLEKISTKTSGRPKFEFANTLCGFDKFVHALDLDDTLRLYRRFIHKHLDQPGGLVKHLKTMSGAIILKLTYGYSIEANKADPLIDLVDRMMVNVSLAHMIQAWMVDIFPALKYLPDALPGMTFKKTAREWNKINQAVANIPYSFVQHQMANGNNRFDDRDKLPYTSGIVKEALRWSPVLPLGTPHVITEDTIYKGYLIPKGAILTPAVWWFCHDPQVYAEPQLFDPERYLEPRNEPDPSIHVFGY